MSRARTVLVGLLMAVAAPTVCGGGLGWAGAARAAEQEAAQPTPPAGNPGDDGQVVFREKGDASVYDDKFQGKKTASGEKFDQKKPMAAHPDLPLGSTATVTNPDTGKKVEVEIVDRGPYAKGRDLDLSEGAAQRIGVGKDVKKEGDAEVIIEVTKGQAERAIEAPEDEKKAEDQLAKARRKAAAEGNPQPKPEPDLEAPPQAAK